MEKDNKFCDLKNNLCKKIIALHNNIDNSLASIVPNQNTRLRILSSIALLPIAVYAIFFSKSLFLLLVLSMAILITFEWVDMTKNIDDQKKWRIIGFFYILIPLFSVYKLRIINADVLFWMFSIIWATDIFAFFSGRAFGGAKLAPHISPNKTWSGLGGGVFASAVIGFISSFIFSGGVLFFVIVSVILSLIEQVSDLTESKFKRIFGVKDSGSIIPGHGGVLDRVDGIMFTAPITLLLLTIFYDKFL